jgi:hypothetical protein
MSRASVLTGFVVDRLGQPMSGVTVTAMRFGYSPATGEKVPSPVTPSAVTDDEGRYRVFGLGPGEYLIAAVFRSGPAAALMELRRLSENDVNRALAGGGQDREAGAAARSPAVGHALTYYPGTVDPARAGVIRLAPSEERSGLNLTIDPVPTSKITPMVSLPEKANPASLQIYLLAQQPGGGTGGSGMMTGRRQPDGQMAFPGIAPGAYTIIARAAAANEAPAVTREAVAGLPFYASVDVTVNGQDVQVPVSLTPGRTVAGRVSVENSATPAAPLVSLRLQLLPLRTGPALAVAPATVEPDGRFEFRGVPAGRYRLAYTAARAFDRWAMVSARTSGREILDELLDVGEEDIVDVAVQFTDDQSELTGRLLTLAGRAAVDYFIIAYTADPAGWRPLSRRIRQGRPATDGTFAVRGLPAGEYYIAALTDVEPGEWYDPAFLGALVPASVKVTVRDGQRTVQDLRIR